MLLFPRKYQPSMLALVAGAAAIVSVLGTLALAGGPTTPATSTQQKADWGRPPPYESVVQQPPSYESALGMAAASDVVSPDATVKQPRRFPSGSADSKSPVKGRAASSAAPATPQTPRRSKRITNETPPNYNPNVGLVQSQLVSPPSFGSVPAPRIRSMRPIPLANRITIRESGSKEPLQRHKLTLDVAMEALQELVQGNPPSGCQYSEAVKMYTCRPKRDSSLMPYTVTFDELQSIVGELRPFADGLVPEIDILPLSTGKFGSEEASFQRCPPSTPLTDCAYALVVTMPKTWSPKAGSTLKKYELHPDYRYGLKFDLSSDG